MFVRRAIYLMLLPLLAGWLEVTPPSPPPAARAAQDIREVDFKNFDYERKTPAEDGRPAVVELREQRFVSDGGAEFSLMRIAYGDLTGDGKEEAAVILRGQNTRVSHTVDEIFIYTLGEGGVALAVNFDGGRRGDYVFGVNIEGGMLKIDLAVMPDTPNKPEKYEDCCVPRQYRAISYRLEGGRAVEVERSPLRAIPEERKEVG